MKKLLALALTVLPALALPQSVYSTWAQAHAPAAATVATTTRAAVPNWRHVATSATVCVSAGATAQTPLQFSLLDGPTVLWTVRLSAPVNSTSCVQLPHALAASLNADLVLASAGATVAGAFATVSLTGYDTI